MRIMWGYITYGVVVSGILTYLAYAVKKEQRKEDQ